MDLTPETLRSATFRDKLRGYHPDDVDEFLESVARGLEVLLARLRDATERARAAAPVEVAPKADEAVRTLALAQRTADLAIHEAKAEAERLVRAAEQKARRMIAGAEDSSAQLAEQAQQELRADLERLQAARDQLFGEVQQLTSWLDGERSRIKRALVDVADRIDNVRDSGDAPTPKPVSLPTPPQEKLAAARAAGTNTPPRERPVPAPQPQAKAEPAPEPPMPAVARPKAATPAPVAAPLPNPKHTPPKGQPVVGASRPAPAPGPAAAPEPTTSGDAAVLSRAQQGVNAPPSFEAADADDDPFFAELRAAMLDQSPLGPRDDDEFAG
ncbi:MAG TPA: DivIVA domain-containing protein [Acidimicrobiales bacterium]|nr:DivIVA domain-containing protein [Acidimicrobiales bacterium]